MGGRTYSELCYEWLGLSVTGFLRHRLATIDCPGASGQVLTHSRGSHTRPYSLRLCDHCVLPSLPPRYQRTELKDMLSVNRFAFTTCG
jgi:hypothetical protein